MTPVIRPGRYGHVFVFSILLGFAANPSIVLASDDSPEAELSASAEEETNHFGALLDVGLPDALGISFVARPWEWLRLHVGPSTNAISVGVRGGATFVPFNYWISPSLTVEGGHLFKGDANTLTRMFGFESDALNEIGYSYMNVHGGIELGAPNDFLFFIHAGFSYAVTSIKNLQGLVQEETGDTSITFQDPEASYFGISGKVGFVLYI